jgi:hypothetical protein
MSIEISDPYAFDLTSQGLTSAGIDLLVPGESAEWRFQARRGDDALSLDGAVIVLSVRRKDSLLDADLVLQRRSIDLLDELVPSVYQITPDADQATEDTATDTGKGWYAVTWSTGDEAALGAMLGSRMYYDVRAQFSDGTVRTLLRGRIEVAYQRTKIADFAP